MEGWRSLDHPGGGWISHSDDFLKKELSSEYACFLTTSYRIDTSWNGAKHPTWPTKAVSYLFFSSAPPSSQQQQEQGCYDRWMEINKKKLISSSRLCSPFLLPAQTQLVWPFFWPEGCGWLLAWGWRSGCARNRRDGASGHWKVGKSNISSDFIKKFIKGCDQVYAIE